MSRIKSIARNLKLILSREIADILVKLETQLNERADQYEKALDERFEDRIVTIEKNYDNRISEAQRNFDERASLIEKRADELLAELLGNLNERLSRAETNFDSRLEMIEKGSIERATNYESALDSRFEERVSNLENRTEQRLTGFENRFEERQSATEERLDAQFIERARAVDDRLDDKFVKIEMQIDERFDGIERRTDERIERHERRTDLSLERNRVDILDRTDIMLQILEQRNDQFRRDISRIKRHIADSRTETGRSRRKQAKEEPESDSETDDIHPETLKREEVYEQPPEEQIISFRKLAESYGSFAGPKLQKTDLSLYQRILDWKKVSSNGLNNFSTDENEVVEYTLSFISDADDRHYAMQHMRRFLATLQRVPPPQRSTDRLLELGSLMHLVPAIKKFTGYNEVCGADMWDTSERSVTETLKQVDGDETHTIELSNFNVERDRFPYPDGHFRMVLCCELIEHLQSDPMHMLWECNRVMMDDGFLLLTTPNITSCRSIEGVLVGCTPYLLSQYNRKTPLDQHNREYAPFEIGIMLAAAGFTVVQLETDDVWMRSNPAIITLLEEVNLPTDMRGDNIFALARKTGAPTERYPEELYID